MACFTVTVAEAIVATVVTKVVESKEKKALKAAHENEAANHMEYDAKSFEAVQTEGKIPFSRKLKWLDYMLWGGSALLAFEHVWHGELVPWFPFLTNAVNPSDAAEMMHEIGTTGVMMAVLLTAVWGGIVAVTSIMEKKAAAKTARTESE